MRAFKLWLVNKILPIWAKAELMRQIEALEKKVREQEVKIRELNAYADGLEMGLRCQRRIVINNRTERMKNEHGEQKID